MKKFLLTALGMAVLAPVTLGAPLDAKSPVSEKSQPPKPRPPAPPPKKTTYKGTAGCQMLCTNGQCKQVNCSVSGCVTKEDAERKLKAMIEAKVQAENGRIQGSISFSISAEW
jgi:hypothetical protein